MTQLTVPSVSDSSFASQTAPEAVTIGNDGRDLHVALPMGQQIDLKAERLRMACRCAHCTRARIDEMFPASFDEIRIETVQPMGHYGINIVFSDGHARGIFPWSFLASLGDS